MTRGTRCEARTQDAPICRDIGASEDAASRRVTPVRRPGLLSGQAPGPPRTKEESMRRIRAGHAAVAATVLLLALVVGATAGLCASDRSTGFQLTIGDIEAYTGDLGSLGAPADKAVKLGVQQLNAAAKKAGNG